MSRKDDRKDSRPASAMSRRDWIKSSAFVGGAAAASTLTPFTEAQASVAAPRSELSKPENIIYSSCLQCHVACQIKAKTWDGTLAKIDGSAYSPLNCLPHIPYETDPADAAVVDAKLCAKGQSGVQTYYDPYRVRVVLKRAGARGSGEWETIPFDRFIDEVTQGGQLFQGIGDSRSYPGFDEVVALRDTDLSKAMAADAKAVGTGDMTVADFKTKYADHVDKLIDPDHPDLGPKNNGFVFDAGRIEHGRKELMKWFTKQSVGSPNAFEHTTICEQSHHIAYDAMTGGNNHHMKPDLQNAEFVIFWGTGAYTANFGLTPMAEKVTTGKVERGMKTAVIDPRLSNDAGKADWWLPVTPGADGALAMAMIRWMLENGRYNGDYLANANKAAATADGDPTWTNSAHLVKIEDGAGRALVRADELGIGSADAYVVSVDGELIAVDPTDESTPIHGDLFVDAEVGDLRLKTSLQLLHDEAMSRTQAEYEAITGVPERQVEEVAREFTSHGKRAVVELYRGPVQHTDGYYAGSAIIAMNVLIGNADWKGGLQKGGSHWHEFGGKPGNVYQFADMHPGALKAFGPTMTREKHRYEDYTLFREEGYPAKRPWYPFSSNIYQEVIPSFAQGYPYPGQILFVHKGTPALASPAGDKVIAMLQDPDRVPLFISCDIVIGETTMYADYVLPDLTFMERWGTPHVTPDVTTMVSKIRQPVAKPLTEDVVVDGRTMPISLEAFLIAVAKRLGLSGFGDDAFGPGMHFNRPEDWHLKAVANIALGDKPGEVVPDASPAEMDLFVKSRRHLPPSVFDLAAWRAAVRPEEWAKVVYVLNRGGRYAPFGSGYSGEYMKKKMGTMFHLFVDRVAGQRNSMNGEYFSGVPEYRGQYDAAGVSLTRDGAYPYRLITFKEAFGGHSRTISNYWTNVALQPENMLWISSQDAARLGLQPQQEVRLTSPAQPDGTLDIGDGRTLDFVAKVDIREGILPGTVGLSWHYGHWAYGSNDVSVDGNVIKGDVRRAAGLCPNPLMDVDPILKDVCLTDPVGASASFFDTYVDVTPV
ncbi:molybdopterin-dependent oxidoreductase [Candidatus Poribacteria bacterium]|nr:molybdopterin-dependent oxidoreductase [Candidatus Poribacteria bacterium]